MSGLSVIGTLLLLLGVSSSAVYMLVGTLVKDREKAWPWNIGLIVVGGLLMIAGH